MSGLSQNRHGDHELPLPAVRITAGDGDGIIFRHIPQPEVEFLELRGIAGNRPGETDESGDRLARHRGDITEIDRHRLSTGRPQADLMQVEVRAIHKHVGRQEDGAGDRAENGRIVAGSE